MIDISISARYLLALSQLPGVGPATLKKVISTARPNLFAIDEIAAQVPAVAKALKIDSAWERAQENAEMQVREAERHDARILCMLDPGYPALLAETRDDPLILFIRGSLAVNPANSVAIIGTREPTPHGRLIAQRITQFFAEAQWSIVSGLAIGCDSLAHEAALDAGAHTVAVLAHGLQMIAPSRNKKLAERILSEGGALVSEYPFGREVQKQQYVKRDRTQAGMAQGVVMIQSDLVGGSLHASRAALEYKRWLAVPYPTDKDRERSEPKIQANLLIAHGDDGRRADLLRCPPSSLNSILILKSREDYLLMKQGVEGIVNHVSSHTASDSPPAPLQKPVGDNAAHDKESTDLAQPIFQDQMAFATANSSVAIEKMAVPTTPLIEITPLDVSTCIVPNALLASSPAITAAVSARLMYLETRHTVVQKALKALKDRENEAHHQALIFAVDDLIDQMGHAAELLVAANSLISERVDTEETAFLDIPASHHNNVNHQVANTILVALTHKLQALKDSSTERLVRVFESLLLEKHEPSLMREKGNIANIDVYGTATFVEQISELCALFNRLAIACSLADSKS